MFRTAAKDDILDPVEVRAGSHLFANLVNGDSEVRTCFLFELTMVVLILFYLRGLPLAQVHCLSLTSEQMGEHFGSRGNLAFSSLYLDFWLLIFSKLRCFPH